MNVKALGIPIYPPNEHVLYEHVLWSDLKLALDKDKYERLHFSAYDRNGVVSVKWLENQK